MNFGSKLPYCFREKQVLTLKSEWPLTKGIGQGHWSIGSGEEDFLRFLPYMGMAAMLVIWPNSFI